jgi:hypothetical protein
MEIIKTNEVNIIVGAYEESPRLNIEDDEDIRPGGNANNNNADTKSISDAQITDTLNGIASGAGGSDNNDENGRDGSKEPSLPGGSDSGAGNIPPKDPGWGEENNTGKPDISKPGSGVSAPMPPSDLRDLLKPSDPSRGGMYTNQSEWSSDQRTARYNAILNEASMKHMDNSVNVIKNTGMPVTSRNFMKPGKDAFLPVFTIESNI